MWRYAVPVGVADRPSGKAREYGRDPAGARDAARASAEHRLPHGAATRWQDAGPRLPSLHRGHAARSRRSYGAGAFRAGRRGDISPRAAGGDLFPWVLPLEPAGGGAAAQALAMR